MTEGDLTEEEIAETRERRRRELLEAPAGIADAAVAE
jgi:hypothetical protein